MGTLTAPTSQGSWRNKCEIGRNAFQIFYAPPALAIIMQRCVFSAVARANYLHQLRRTEISAKSIAKSISRPVSTHHAASTFPLVLKITDFYASVCELVMGSKQAGRRLSRDCCSSTTSKHGHVHNRFGAALNMTAHSFAAPAESPRCPANPPPPRPSQRTPRNPKEQLWKEEGTPRSGESEREGEGGRQGRGATLVVTTVSGPHSDPTHPPRPARDPAPAVGCDVPGGPSASPPTPAGPAANSVPCQPRPRRPLT